MVVKIIRRKFSIVYEFNTVLILLEVEDMGSMFGKSSAEPGLKLHLLRLEMQSLTVASRRENL